MTQKTNSKMVESKLNHINNYIKYEWFKYPNLKREIVRLDVKERLNYETLTRDKSEMHKMHKTNNLKAKGQKIDTIYTATIKSQCDYIKIIQNKP